MMHRVHAYRAILIKDSPQHQTLGVVFPELPGCVSVGDTVEEATAMAHEALALHLEGTLSDGDPLPPPVPLEAQLPDWLLEVEPMVEVARIMVRVRVDVAAVPA